MKKACVIVGAGASHDVHNQGWYVNDGRWKPPLAADLFNIAENEVYAQIMRDYPGAGVLASDLGPSVSAGVVGMEQTLREYADTDDTTILGHFRHIPPYLRDLLYRASTEYTTVPSCYLDLAIELLWRSPHELLFLVLNYDNLLESALTLYDSTLTFSSIGDFVRRERGLLVVKLHGSIDWFKPIGPGQPDWLARVSQASQFDIFAKPKEDQIVVRGGVSTARNCEQGPGEWLYPLLTAPLAGKDVDDMVCPLSHINEAMRFLADCKKFLIIGTSGLDEDILGLLRHGVAGPPALVHVVTENSKVSAEVWERFARVSAFAKILEPPVAYESGFRTYLTSRDFQRFCRA